MEPTRRDPSAPPAETLSRRRFVRAAAGAAGLAGVGAAGILSSCQSTRMSADPARSTKRLGRLHDIDHVVIVFQENRSFDHYFGVRRGVAGFASTPEGRRYRNPTADRPEGYLLPWRLDGRTTAAQCASDPAHLWGPQHDAWNSGRNDGFARTMGEISLGFLTRAEIPFHWALADEFTLCDHYFCSVIGETNPNRHMAMTGTIDPRGIGGGPAIHNYGVSYRWETYPERLQRAGISWRVYHERDDFDDNNLKFFAAFQNLDPSDPLHRNAMVNRPPDAFENDAAAGNLPQVSWLVAPMLQSEHAPFPPSRGEHFVARAVRAVMGNAETWRKTLFILSYDENGGFFDHMGAPTPEPGTTDEFVEGLPIGLGFRVPTTLVSPWTRRPPGEGRLSDGARVHSGVFDHTSILQLLESRFGVEAPLISAWRRDTCGNLADVLDFSAFDDSVPDLPDTAARAQDFEAHDCGELPPPSAPREQTPATTIP